MANSWQQTPTGFEIRNGRAELVSFWGAVFNPSSLYRYAHTMFACILAGAFFVVGCACFILLRKSGSRMAAAALKVAVPIGFGASLLVAFPSGHEHGIQVARTQPEKFAAMEGLYQTQRYAPLLVFGVPQSNPPVIRARVEVPVPGLLSLMAFGDPAAEVKGIDAFPPENLPPLWLTFVAFHNMVMLGGLFILLLGFAFLQQCRRRLLPSRKLLWALCLASPLPLLASELGWIVAEVGRQPWIVYQVLRTRDAVSHNLTAAEVWISLSAYVLVYGLLFALYLYVIFHLLRKESSSGEALAA